VFTGLLQPTLPKNPVFIEVVTVCYTLLRVMLQVATSIIARIYRACYSVTGPWGVHTPPACIIVIITSIVLLVLANCGQLQPTAGNLAKPRVNSTQSAAGLLATKSNRSAPIRTLKY